MKKVSLALLILVLLSLILANTALAQTPGTPVGSCRRGFTLDLLSNHSGEIGALGSLNDRNGDGYICYQRASDSVHRHLDNFVRIRCRPR